MNLGRYDCAKGVITVLHTAGDLTVRTASILDAPLIDKLQRENSYAVGFIQRTIWDKYVFGGERNFFVLIVEANADPVGYCLVTPGKGPDSYIRIQQIAVRDDARRLHYGSALLAVLSAFCAEHQRAGAKLRCRADLPSNLFWRALGFTCYGVWIKGSVNHVGMRASDDINQWMIDFAPQSTLFASRDFVWPSPVIKVAASPTATGHDWTTDDDHDYEWCRVCLTVRQRNGSSDAKPCKGRARVGLRAASTTEGGLCEYD